MKKLVFVLFVLSILSGCSPTYVGLYQSDSYLIALSSDSTFFYAAGFHTENINTGHWNVNNRVISFDSDVKKIVGFELNVREKKIDTIPGTTIVFRNYLNEPIPTAYLFYNDEVLIKNIFVDSIYHSKVTYFIDSLFVKVFMNGSYVQSEVYHCLDSSSNYFDIKLLLPISFDKNTFQCLDTINMKYRCGRLYRINNNKISRYGLKRRKKVDLNLSNSRYFLTRPSL